MHRDSELRNGLKFHSQFCSAGIDLGLPYVWHIHLSSPPVSLFVTKRINAYLSNRARMHPSVVAKYMLLRTQNILYVLPEG